MGQWFIDNSFSFVRLPKALFTNPLYKDLSTDAKLLYSFILDRACLSDKNGWTDVNGDVFVYFTLNNINEIFGWSERTAIRKLNELKKYLLIQIIKQGHCKPNIIKILKFIEENGDKNNKNDISGTDKIKVHDLPNLQSNNTDINNTDFNNTPAEFEMLIQKIKNQIDFSSICLECGGPSVLEEIVNIIAHIYVSDKAYYVVNGGKVSKDYLRYKFQSLNPDHIISVCKELDNISTPVSNYNSFVINLLYSSLCNMSIKYIVEEM